jgi:hypothetical protein
VEPSLEAVRGLRDKYGEIHALRVEHARGDAVDPRTRMRALARRFPGALRELDELPMELIEARLRALDAALAAGPPFASWPWIALQALDQVLLELSAQDVAGDADALLLDRAAVAVILEPPGGRLGPWVLAEVARQAGVDAEAVRRALFLGTR